MGAPSLAPPVIPESARELEVQQVSSIDLLAITDEGLKQVTTSSDVTRSADRVLPWEATVRGPLNLKFLELRGMYKDIFDALGGGDAFIAELRRDPADPST